MSLFPGAIASFLGFTSGHTLSADQHASQHNSEQAEIIAAQTKIGIGNSTPTSGMLLRGNGAGTSAWAQANLTTDVSGVLPTANGGTGGQTNFLAIIYPVGCIYTETSGVNPGTTFGFGTWVAFGKGRVLIGAGTSDQIFTAGATGGESNHALIIAELATHTHIQDTHTHAQNGSAGGVPGSAYVAATDTSAARNGMSGSLGVQANDNTIATNQNTGSGTAHNNLPPYLVIYYWNRTA